MQTAGLAASARPTGQDVFVARQPILDVKQVVVGYELLFRSGIENACFGVSSTLASSRVIHDAVNVFGFETLGQGKKVFINVDRAVLLSDLLFALPPATTVVEILETIVPDLEVAAACRKLQQAGYTIALDDFANQPGWEALIRLADIVKIDFLSTRGSARAAPFERSRNRRAVLLAEKVETEADFVQAKELGYELFQGYFFCRPEMLHAREIQASKLGCLRLIEAVGKRDLDLVKIESLFRAEPALTVKLLRYLNSAAFAWQRQVKKLQDALRTLGERPLRRWVSMMALAGLGSDRPSELVSTALVRARLCEGLAVGCRLGGREEELFLLGLLSLVDALLAAPLNEALDRLSLAGEVRAALVEGKGPLAKVLALVVAYERADWEQVTALAAELKLPEAAVAEAHRGALAWVQQQGAI